ncbi:MAG: hypothetical protein Q8P53_03900 [Candidatus Shapirobacteria bacterium]|nr:hypothetical protein [Candidatus Shapirobacteria bacterium]
MKISEKDIKLLWGKSGNRCSICHVELSSDKKTSTKDYPLGEQAHIVAEESSGPRGESQLTSLERNSYSNLVLLCPTHHTAIDKDTDYYSIEKLQFIKSNNEQWVREKLSSIIDLHNEAKDMVYADLIDKIVKFIDLEHWDSWSSHLLSSLHRMDQTLRNSLLDLQVQVSKTLWSGKYPDLEKAMKLLSKYFGDVLGTYLENAELNSEGDYKGVKFYKNYYGKAQSVVSEKVAEYDKWEEDLSTSMHEATKSLNLFADKVREHFNPFFYVTDGKFMIVEGPYEDLEFKYYTPEFTNLEKQTKTS